MADMTKDQRDFLYMLGRRADANPCVNLDIDCAFCEKHFPRIARKFQHYCPYNYYDQAEITEIVNGILEVLCR